MPCEYCYFPDFEKNSLSQEQAKVINSLAFKYLHYVRNSMDTSNFIFSPLCFSQALSFLRYDHVEHSKRVWRIEELVPKHIPVLKVPCGELQMPLRQGLQIASLYNTNRPNKYGDTSEKKRSSSDNGSCGHCDVYNPLQQNQKASFTSVRGNANSLPKWNTMDNVLFSAFWNMKNVSKSKGKFHGRNNVEMLCFKGQSLNHTCDRINPLENYTCQAVELPFENDKYSAIIVLPRKDRTVWEALKNIDSHTWNYFLRSMKPQKIELVVPRFKLEKVMPSTDFFVKTGFKELGEVEMKHGCTLLFTENGINVGEGEVKSEPLQDKESRKPPTRVVVNRPFFFAIRERHHGAILFMGIVEDPLRVQPDDVVSFMA